MATFDRLPQEICNKIVSYISLHRPGNPLDKEDLQNLKNVRLTCKALQPECERLLFDHLTVWPQPLNLERLVNIASAPHLRRHVHSLQFDHSMLPDTPLSFKESGPFIWYKTIGSGRQDDLRCWKECTTVIEEYVKDTKDGYLIDLLARALREFSELTHIYMEGGSGWGTAAISERTLLSFEPNLHNRLYYQDNPLGSMQLKLLIHAGQRLMGLPGYYFCMDVWESHGGIFSLNSDDLKAAKIAFKNIEVLDFNTCSPLHNSGDVDDHDEGLQNLAISKFLSTMENVDDLRFRLTTYNLDGFGYRMLNNFVGFNKLEWFELALGPHPRKLGENHLFRFFEACSATLTGVVFHDFDLEIGSLQNLFPRLRKMLQLSSFELTGKLPYYKSSVGYRFRREISKELIEAIGRYVTKRTDTLPTLLKAPTAQTSNEEDLNT